MAHLLRAACEVTGDPDMLVVGSQSILASHHEDELPAPATASIEADIAFLNDPGDAKADRVDGAIGELSLFHQRFGYYAQGVSVSTAVLPAGWRDRLVRWQATAAGPSTPVFIDKHDLVVSKLVAMREKDVAFASALIDAGLIDVDTLRLRAQQLPDDLDERAVARIASFLDHAS